MRILHTRPKLHRRYEVKGLAYSPDGRYLLAGVERRMRDEWNPSREGRLLRFDLFDPAAEPLEVVDRGIIEVAWSPASNRIVAVTGSKVIATDPDFDRVTTAILHYAKDATFEPDGRHVWITNTQFSRGRLFRYAFEPNGDLRLVEASRGGGQVYVSVALRDQGGLEARGRFGALDVGDFDSPSSLHHTPQRGWVQHLAFSPDGRTLAAVSGWRVVLWDVATDPLPLLIAELKGHTKEVTGIAFTPDGRWLLSVSLDETVRLWNPVTGEPGPCLDLGLKALRSVACSPDGMTAAVGGSGRKAIAVFDLE